MTWVKTFPNGTTAWGDRIDGPDFTLTDESDIPVDGWRWVPNYDPETADDPLAAVVALLAQVTPDQLARVLALGVAVTEPDSVARLTTAVETGELADGVAVVAEAASTAHAITEVQP